MESVDEFILNVAPDIGTINNAVRLMTTDNFQHYSLGNVPLLSGMTLVNAHIAYKTYGTLNPEKNNCIVYPTWYSGTHRENEWLIGEHRALDPNKYFIIVPNMLGNGLSSSPSNTPEPFNGPRFPYVSLYDQVTLQHRLVTELFDIQEIALVTGWSMGAMQTFSWGALYPKMVKRIAPFCGSAKCSVHNFVFLEGPKSALLTDHNFNQGFYDVRPQLGLRAFARVYAGWGFSQAFYREKLFTQLGFHSVEDFLVGFWEAYFLQKDPNNLLAMLKTWQYGDISDNPVFGGDFKKALRAISAKALVMPGETDLYFPKEDSAFEVEHMQNAKLVVIPSIWGHWAGGPGTNPLDVDFVDRTIRELLAS